MLFDYKVADSKFAGPTMFSRGDTTYINDRGELICKQRSTSVRYLPANAHKKDMFAGHQERSWTDQELEDLEKRKMDYTQSFLDLGHDKRLFVKVGDPLPTRPIGPHTLMSFTTEWRSYIMTVWGASREYGESSTLEAGWLPEMSRDTEGAKVDPAYGYGASMGAWILDTLSNWGGEWSFIVHSQMQYRWPALTGDATFLDGEVVELVEDRTSGQLLATVRVTMTNQDGDIMAIGNAEMLLPLP